jgi:hypothetical protein
MTEYSKNLILLLNEYILLNSPCTPCRAHLGNFILLYTWYNRLLQIFEVNPDGARPTQCSAGGGDLLARSAMATSLCSAILFWVLAFPCIERALVKCERKCKATRKAKRGLKLLRDEAQSSAEERKSTHYFEDSNPSRALPNGSSSCSSGGASAKLDDIAALPAASRTITHLRSPTFQVH